MSNPEISLIVQDASGTQHGPLNLEEIKRKISTGELSSTDWAHHDGAEDWYPLSEYLNWSEHSDPKTPITHESKNNKSRFFPWGGLALCIIFAYMYAVRHYPELRIFQSTVVSEEIIASVAHDYASEQYPLLLIPYNQREVSKLSDGQYKIVFLFDKRITSNIRQLHEITVRARVVKKDVHVISVSERSHTISD